MSVAIVTTISAGDDTTGTPFPEGAEIERFIFEFPPDQRGDQETGDYKEYIHTDIAAGTAETGMIEHHHKHRDSTESIDVGSVAKFIEQEHDE